MSNESFNELRDALIAKLTQVWEANKEFPIDDFCALIDDYKPNAKSRIKTYKEVLEDYLKWVHELDGLNKSTREWVEASVEIFERQKTCSLIDYTEETFVQIGNGLWQSLSNPSVFRSIKGLYRVDCYGEIIWLNTRKITLS